MQYVLVYNQSLGHKGGGGGGGLQRNYTVRSNDHFFLYYLCKLILYPIFILIHHILLNLLIKVSKVKHSWNV